MRREVMIFSESKERGSSLVEVLASMLILLCVLLGVLQLFTMAMMTNRVADAQSEMSRKAHAVTEVIRMIRSNVDPAADTSGILPLAPGGPKVDLPRTSSDPNWAFWGPDGVGVMETFARYQISYQVAAGPANSVIVTVIAVPYDGTDVSTDKGMYLAGPQKGVRYVARIEQS